LIVAYQNRTIRTSTISDSTVVVEYCYGFSKNVCIYLSIKNLKLKQMFKPKLKVFLVVLVINEGNHLFNFYLYMYRPWGLEPEPHLNVDATPQMVFLIDCLVAIP
jgi:hypothetical protein